MRTKDGWTLEREHEKITLGRKQYRNMEEWSRPCRVCGEKFGIFTRANAQTLNAAFGLRTCKNHRGQAGLSPVQAATVATSDREALEARIRNLTDECNGHLSFQQELSARIQALETELARYKPPSAQDAIASVQKMPWT